MIANGVVTTPSNNEGLVIANGVPQTRHNGLIIVNGVPRVTVSAATLMDSWAKAQYSAAYTIRVGADRGGGQSVTGDGGVLDYINFIVKKMGSPTGNCYAKVYAHSGVFGTSSVAGALLATSNPVDISIFNSATDQWRRFNFGGAARITLTNTTKYFISFEYDGGDASHYVQFGYDNVGPAHGGNLARETPDETWIAINTQDACFEVWTI